MDPHLPPEIWRKVLRFATFTATSLNAVDWDPRWSYARSQAVTHLAWTYESTLSTKKAITLVSRHFRELSIEYLYEHVHLFSTHNAMLLLVTILSHTTAISSPDSAAKWIKHIFVKLRKNEDSDEMDAVLMQIFPHCQKLAGFGWESNGQLQDTNDDSELMASIPLSITGLEWNRNSYGRSFNSLRNHTALRHLRVSDLSSHSQDLHAVTMPFVTHLDVRAPMTCIAASQWGLPSISHLTTDWRRGQNFERLVSRDTLRSLYISPTTWTTLDAIPRILATMPKLETFSYDVAVNTLYPLHYSSTWLGVGSLASLTRIHLICRIFSYFGNSKRSFSAIRDFFFDHLQPLMTKHPPLTIGIVDAQLMFEHWNFRENGYHAAAKEKFFDDLSASLSSTGVQITVM
ncbi:hypothetical protein BD410DRAFT_793803 [Rickenella mellea]|uniref:F-box domain-containing protein n=1 Tax=Rickenella mellea TaxID=50990 RepID=A0A4Y7PST7_9AGAM|nr:hypothetical protein BD410DRAFT_793803 [Rickenella mellea]